MSVLGLVDGLVGVVVGDEVGDDPPVGVVVGLGEELAVGLDEGDSVVGDGDGWCTAAETGVVPGPDDPPETKPGVREARWDGAGRCVARSAPLRVGAAGCLPAASAARVPPVAAAITAAAASMRTARRRDAARRAAAVYGGSAIGAPVMGAVLIRPL
jgi:hypothetical protein